ncbi:hypothetical protein CANINC_003689 [Pichia inconspicua]|uniref:Cyclin-like domain-containing protein n=1 Tax=Pichia inconspicua TaxID=52247 RepID=A0A4T0WY44_9ASCO|nr:hypothetical protein CANINC_003689 [[Candida] inconspicua]
MSANYWISSQRSHWQYTKENLIASRLKIMTWEKQKTINTPLSVKYDTNMRIYIHQMVAKLGRRMSLRQIVLATAEVYILRFATKVSMLEYNLYMLIATSVYLASKVCELPQHIRTVLWEARNCWPEFICGDFTKLAEFEFYLIEELDCYMIIHHPYNSLKQLIQVLGRENDDKIVSSRNIQYKLNLTEQEIENTWKIINDSYITDLPLLYPPHIIAIAAMHLVLVLRWEITESDSADAKRLRSTPNGMKNLESSGSLIVEQTHKGSTKSISATSPTKMTKSSSSRLPVITGDNFTEELNGLFDIKPLSRTHGSQFSTRNSNISKQTVHSSKINTRSNSSTQIKRTSNIGLRRKLSHSISRSRGNSLHMSPEKIDKHTSRPDRIECFVNFLAGSNVNLEEVIDSVQELLILYESWQHYDETQVRQNLKLLITALNNSNLS